MTEEVKKPTREKALPMMARAREEIHPEIRISYNEDDHHIPEDVIKRFKAEGFTLRWIRYRIGEREDYANISRKAKHGWTFVGSDEVPELGVSTQITNFGRYAGLVTIEDVALAKCRTKYVKELQKLKADRARQQIQAEEEKVARAGLERDHKTRISHGKRKPTFENDETNETE
jgi:hypothetical protein